MGARRQPHTRRVALFQATDRGDWIGNSSRELWARLNYKFKTSPGSKETRPDIKQLRPSTRTFSHVLIPNDI